MRVLVVGSSDHSPYLTRLMLRLSSLGVDLHFTGAAGSPERLLLERGGVRCHDVSVRHKLDPLSYRRLGRLMDTLRIDLLHAISGRDAFVGILTARRRRLPVVIRRGAYPRLSRFDPSDRVVFGPRGADRVLAVSEDLCRHMIAKGVAPHRVLTLYTGIWSEHLVPQRRDLRREHSIPRDRALLGFVGNLRPVKGFDVLLDALPRVQGDVHLFVAGRDYERLDGEIDRRGLRGRVTFLGCVPDILTLLPNLDLVVAPPRIDALPRAAVEATVVGTPVVATRVGGLPEILDHGRGGLLCEPEGLAAAIDEALSDRVATRARADHAQARNRELFGIDRCARDHLAAYASL